MRPASGEDGCLPLAHGDLCGGCHTCWGGGRWKSQNRKIVPLSPYVEEPLNSKVIKSFVPEQRSCQVFFVFRDSYVLSLWTFDGRFTHSRICLWYNGKGTGRTGNQRINQDHPDYSIMKIGQNTKKSPGDLRRLTVIQTPGKDHQLTLVWKTLWFWDTNGSPNLGQTTKPRNNY